jgi:branched-chain amino acid transport system permease protein
MARRPVIVGVAGAAAVLALALVPLLSTRPYVLHMGVVLFLAVIQGQAWNVVGGYAGQHSLGHAAYFGLGAYATVMLLELHGVPPWWGVWAGVAAAVALSAVIGSITFRLRGPYFVLASIAVAEIIRLAALYFKSVTHGAEGLLVSGVPPLRLLGVEIDFLGKRPFYLIALAVAAITVAVNWGVERSKLGAYFQAIREDQDAAASLGIHLALYKNLALAISAAFAGFAGGFYGVYVQFIDPNTVFGIDVSIEFVLICIIGGIGRIYGPLVGALVLVPLSEALRAHLANAHLLVYGVLVVVVMLFAPEGVLGLLRDAAARLGRRRRGAT